VLVDVWDSAIKEVRYCIPDMYRLHPMFSDLTLGKVSLSDSVASEMRDSSYIQCVITFVCGLKRRFWLVGFRY
jgi:hypothetical protein